MDAPIVLTIGIVLIALVVTILFFQPTPEVIVTTEVDQFAPQPITEPATATTDVTDLDKARMAATTPADAGMRIDSMSHRTIGTPNVRDLIDPPPVTTHDSSSCVYNQVDWKN
jgi:hypothetical protein